MRLRTKRCHISRVDAEVWAQDRAVTYKLWNDALGNVDRDRKTYSRGGARGRFDLRVDSNHPAMRVEQRSARVTWIDRSVSLNRTLNLPAILGLDRPLQAADDSGCQSPVKPERVSNRQNFLPDNQLVRITQGHDGQ